jgi:hypothetical protein
MDPAEPFCLVELPQAALDLCAGDSYFQKAFNVSTPLPPPALFIGWSS